MNRGLSCLASAALALTLNGCDLEDFGPSDRYKEDFRETRPLKPGGRLYVDNFNGSVEVTPWDQDQVEITGTKYASSEEVLKALKVDVTAVGDTVEVRTRRPSERRGNMGARLTIRVPRRTNLDRVETSNGSIRVEGLEGSARLRTSNGSVRAASLKGNADIQTSNGSIELRDLEGAAEVRTSNGTVRVERNRGPLEATTTNGRITAHLVEAAPGKSIRLQTTNGSVELTMEQFRDNELRVSTTNSSIAVHLPASAGARLSARTSNGSVSSDFALEETRAASKTRLEGRLGSGGPLIDLSTTNGSIRVTKL